MSEDRTEEATADYYSRFERTISVQGIKVPKENIQTIARKHKDARYSRKGIRPVVDDKDDASKKIWLVAPGKMDDVSEVEGERVDVDVKLTAVNFSGNEILREMLPEGMTVPASFETVGHIAHINLKEEHHPYRFLIGQVIIDKNPGVKTVVNKLASIGSEFREFKFELLGGKAEYTATIKQHGCVFTFPYDRVYWNSRLQTEHDRLVNVCKKGDIIADVMAGVGPFVIPAAKKGHTCYGNDLNPESYKALVANCKTNGVTRNVTSSCLDGRAFIHKIRDTVLQEPGSDVHFIMNLPATAVEFLDAFKDWPTETYSSRTVVHVYCFSSEPDFKKHSIELAMQNLGVSLAKEVTEVSTHQVRNVAPKKEMLCVTFRLPNKRTGEESEAKKRKTE